MSQPVQEASARLSPSAIYCAAAGVPPLGKRQATPSEVGTPCAMCAVPIAAGQLVTHVKGQFDDSFNNKFDLIEGATLICGHCKALRRQDWMQKYAKTYACAHGVFNLSSNEDQARFLLSPPAGPYVAILLGHKQKQQHLIWRAPVNLSPDLIQIRMGDEVLFIRRRELLQEILPAWNAIQSFMKETGIKGLPATFHRELALCSLGTVRADVARAIATLPDDHPSARDLQFHLARLNRCNMGDWWALGQVRQFDGNDLLASPPVLLASPDGTRHAVAKEEPAEA